MSDFRKYDVQLARAVASAVQSDYLRLPANVKLAVAKGQLTAPGLRDLMLRDLEVSVRDPRVKALFPSLRGVLRTQMNIEETKLRGGMSQWAELATAIAGAASGLVSAKITSDASKDIAKIQLQQQQLALQTAQAQANMAKLQLAQAQGFPEAASGGGLPSWAIPTAVGGVAVTGLIVYLMSRNRRGR